jgi:hypothetical protein
MPQPKIKIQYRKVTNSKLPIAKYYPRGYGGRNGKPEVITDVVIKVDPILKGKSKDGIRKQVLRHEMDEIAYRNRGYSLSEAHVKAHKNEPKILKGRNHKQIYNLIKGME